MGYAIAAMQIFSAIKGYQAEKKAEKETKRANAAITARAQEEANLAIADAAVRAQKEKAAAAQVRSQQIALYLKSGVTLDGSPMLVGDVTTEQGDENARNIMSNAESQARSYILQGQANQLPVKKADFFGTAATVLSAGQSAMAKGK